MIDQDNVRVLNIYTVKPLKSGHLRVFKNLSVIMCPLLGVSLTKIVAFETKHFVRYSRHVRYWEVLLLEPCQTSKLELFAKIVNGGR